MYRYNNYILWYEQYSYIQWLRYERNKNNKNVRSVITSINISIIIFCCTVIEGFFYTIIKDHLYFLKNKHDDPVLINILNNYARELEAASFEKYKKLFELTTYLKLNEINTDKTTKAVKTLFQFRNELVHGNEYESRINDENFSNSRYTKIINYGLENKLIENSIDNNLNIFTNARIYRKYT